MSGTSAVQRGSEAVTNSEVGRGFHGTCFVNVARTPPETASASGVADGSVLLSNLVTDLANDLEKSVRLPYLFQPQQQACAFAAVASNGGTRAAPSASPASTRFDEETGTPHALGGNPQPYAYASIYTQDQDGVVVRRTGR